MIVPLFIGLLLASQSPSDLDSASLNSGPAETLLKSGNYFQYIRKIEQELIQSPLDAGLHASLALGYHLLGQRKFCDEEIQQALSLVNDSHSPDVSVRVHYLAGRLDMEDKKYEAAIKELQLALVSDPANSKIEYFWGFSLQALNQRENARAHFEHACLAQDISWPCRALAEIELDEGKIAAAQQHSVQAVRIEPTSSEAQLAAGKSAQASGDKSRAVSFFREAAELDPDWEVPHFLLAHVYQELPGMAAEATHELMRFQELYNASQ
jgi:Flp pilus assembly protein TadD